MADASSAAADNETGRAEIVEFRIRKYAPFWTLSVALNCYSKMTGP
jgi:hypothetical protein